MNEPITDRLKLFGRAMALRYLQYTAEGFSEVFAACAAMAEAQAEIALTPKEVETVKELVKTGRLSELADEFSGAEGGK